MMSSRTPQGNLPDAPKVALDAIETVLRSTCETGDTKDFVKLLHGLGDTLGLSNEVLDSLSNRMRTKIDDLRRDVWRDLRDEAEKFGVEVQCRPPYATLGAVKLEQKPSGDWALSVHDSVILETFRDAPGRLIAERVIDRIEKIEAALKDVRPFAEALVFASESVSGSQAGEVSANVLMVMSSFGRSLKKCLTSSDHLPATSPGLSRAQFGYLLCRLSDLGFESTDPGIPSLRFHGATQFDTKQTYRYVSVPKNSDPRRISDAQLVAKITVSVREKLA
jgi:hypothetical protein